MTSVGSFPSSEVSTSLADARAVPPDMRANEAHDLLLQLRFDQAPVVSSGRLVGWVRTSDLSGQALVRSSLIPLDQCVVLARDTPVSDAIASVAQNGLVFLAGRTGITDFVVPSDLDRH